MTMQLIETVTVGSGGASSIEFTSIPQDGVDLLLVANTRQDAFGDNNIFVRFNNDTASNYDSRWLQGSGSAASSINDTSATRILTGPASPGPSATANTFGNTAITIANYTSSVAKSVSVDTVTENNATAAYQAITAARWSGTDAISAITLTGDAADFVEHSTASLYKITAD
jgi:hypothetical protein